MRKLGTKNIRLFILFTVIVIATIAIFIYGVITVLSYDKSIYQVEEGTYFFDNKNNVINLKESGEVSKNWDGNYYLKTNLEKYNLGKQTISSSNEDYRIYAYGTIYQTFEDGTVLKHDGKTEIVKNTSASFYKLADRRYLMVDKEIADDKKEIIGSSYLYIILDKQGNALLLNDELNLKTLNSVILTSDSFKFDVAKEILTFNKEEMDLKKLIGSTNEYVEKEITTKPKEKDKIDNIPQITLPVNKHEPRDSKKINYQKMVSLNNTSPSITFIDVSYTVIDPANTFQSVYLLINNNETTNKIELNKEENKYRILNLEPNHEYKISLGYSFIDEENENNFIERIDDIIKVRTNKPKYEIEFTKITFDRVYFNLKIDPLYKLESGVLALYSDNTKLRSISINPNRAATSSGWESYIEITNLGYEVILALEDAVYNGMPVNYETTAKFINN